MYFSEETVKELKNAYAEIEGKYQSLLITYTTRTFSNKKASEFALHGFTRRVGTMKVCIDNVYEVCPPDIDRKLSWEELSNLAINLQAFVMNVYGSLDNLVWIWVKEKGILNENGNQLSKSNIGLTKKYEIIRNSFSSDFKSYLKTIDYWLDYVVDFRDSLAHRIPLYVPPYALTADEIEKEKNLEALKIQALKNHQFEEYESISNEIDKLGKFVPLMTHSFGEKSPKAVFHAQIIADWNTVMQISENFIKELDKKNNK